MESNGTKDTSKEKEDLNEVIEEHKNTIRKNRIIFDKLQKNLEILYQQDKK